MLRVAFVLRSTEVHPVFSWFVYPAKLLLTSSVILYGTFSGSTRVHVYWLAVCTWSFVRLFVIFYRSSVILYGMSHSCPFVMLCRLYLLCFLDLYTLRNFCLLPALFSMVLCLVALVSLCTHLPSVPGLSYVCLWCFILPALFSMVLSLLALVSLCTDLPSVPGFSCVCLWYFILWHYPLSFVYPFSGFLSVWFAWLSSRLRPSLP